MESIPLRTRSSILELGFAVRCMVTGNSKSTSLQPTRATSSKAESRASAQSNIPTARSTKDNSKMV